MKTVIKEYSFDDLFQLGDSFYQTISDGIDETIDEIVKEKKIDESKILEFRHSITVKIELDIEEKVD